MTDATQSTPPTPSENDRDVIVNENNDNRSETVEDDSQSPSGASPSSHAIDDSLVLHPLEYEWTYWYDKRPGAGRRLRGEQEAYESNLRPIGSFGTVEDFWRYYNHIFKPSKMEANANQHLFKKDVKPMWEDAANSKGGKWIIVIRNDKVLLDSCWENLVLALVGETLEAGDEVCGAVVSRRKNGDKIAVWNRNKHKDDAILALGKKLKSLLGLEGKLKMVYQFHEDSMKSGASYSNPDKHVL